MTKDQIQSYLDKHFSGDVWTVYNDRIIYLSSYSETRGTVLEKPIKTEQQLDALAHLLLKTYRFRRPLTINALHVEGDKSFRTQEELEKVLVG